MSDSALGTGFGRLWTAAISSNLADGVCRLAIPLTAVTLTTDPVAISVFTALSYLPWLLFGVPSGMIVDRIDRRVAMGAANAARVVAAAWVALAIATGTVNLWVLAAATLVFGLGETLFDNATNAVLPSLVKRSGLDRANGRIQAAQTAVDMFVATPISGLLFSLAVALPMIVGGAGYLIAIALVLALPVAAARSRHVDANGADVAPVPLRTALLFLWRHRFLRAMVLMTSAVAALLAFAQAVTVLLFVDRFGLAPGLVGLVTAGIGLGAVVGALTAERVVARWGRGRTMLGASVVGGLGLVAVGFAPHPWVAVACYAVGAYGVSTWNVPWGSLRQAIIPGHMLGRVLGAARTVSWGLLPAASILGGVVARIDLQLPFILGGGLSIVIVLAAARLILSADAHMPEDDEDVADGSVAADVADGSVADTADAPSPLAVAPAVPRAPEKR